MMVDTGLQRVSFQRRDQCCYVGAEVAAERRRVASSEPIAKRFGMGWFVLPNPVYGAALKGSYDQIFPSATRWVDPGEAGAN